MLVIRRLLGRRPTGDDRGAVLVTVVVVMLVGFIVASTIAASVIFTIQANDDNRDNLDAFVAAESGRDVAVASVVGGCAATHFPTGTLTAAPYYDTDIFVTDGDQPSSSTDAGVVAGCPDADTKFVVVNSLGTGPDGSTAEIDAVYPWQVVYEEQPGGTLAYFDGTFTTTKSNYKGDLIVRDPDALYNCNNAGTIEGDLYVLDGNANFSSACTIKGDVYVSGWVQFSSQDITIEGDVIAGGDIDMVSNGNDVTGMIHSGGDVNLTATGSTNGTVGAGVKAAGTATVDTGKWIVTGAVQSGQAAPVFNPTMDQIYDMTTWLDMTPQNWNPTTTVTNTCAASFKPTPLLDDALTTLMIDYTSCGGSKIDIVLTGGLVTRDVVFVVAPGKRMNVSIEGNLTVPAGTSPQLVFVHGDNSLNHVGGETVPHCGNGSTKDTFDIPGAYLLETRIMLYTPCGLTGNVKADFQGQFYTANDGNHTIDSIFTCTPMSWPPAFEELSCKIKGAGGAGGGYELIERLGELLYQTEK